MLTILGDTSLQYGTQTKPCKCHCFE